MNGSLTAALLMSLKVALTATIVVGLIGVPLAYFSARRTRKRWGALDAILVVPLVLPPTVVGFLIVMAMGARSPLGSLLRRVFGYSILFNWHGAVIAASVVSLPLLYLPAKAAFAGIDREFSDVARLMGAGNIHVFFHVSLPLARRGIASGLLLAFARSLGEFGATVMVLGDLPRRQTLPISIYNDYVSGATRHALPAVILLAAVSLGVVVVYNHVFVRPQE